MTDKNKELHSVLFDLEKELNSLKSAKQQIEEVISIGSNVVKNFEAINNGYAEHLSDLKEDYESKLELLQSTTEEIKTNHNSYSEEINEISKRFIKDQSDLNSEKQNKLGKFAEEIKDSQNVYSEKLKNVSSKFMKKHSELLSNHQNKLEKYAVEIKNKQNSYSTELRALSKSFLEEQMNLSSENQSKLDKYNKEIKLQISEFLSSQNKTNDLKQNELISNTRALINDSLSTLNHSVSQTTRVYEKQNQKINEQLDFYNSFVKKVENLTNTIDNINFPNRLDKIDNTISAINIGIQNNQAKLDDLNKSLRKELNDTRTIVNDKFEKLEKAINIKNKNTLIAVGIGLLIGMIILIKLFL